MGLSEIGTDDAEKPSRATDESKIEEFSSLRKRYWGRHFWGRGYFSVTSGNVTQEMIDTYINDHADKAQRNQES